MLSEEKEILEYIREAFSLRSQELYKPAIELLYKALDMDNDNVEVLFQLGELYFFVLVSVVSIIINNYQYFVFSCHF